MRQLEDVKTMSQPNRKPGVTDWKRVKREAAQDAPIAHIATDSPYDPNDAAAVDAYWQQASINAALREAVAHGLTKA
jgi:endo-1,4-beta-D-glucanase Y